jgi:hypothetical protein
MAFTDSNILHSQAMITKSKGASQVIYLKLSPIKSKICSRSFIKRADTIIILNAEASIEV